MVKTPDTNKTKKAEEYDKYIQTQMRKDIILQKLRDKGYRITKQRQILIDIILDNDCSSCKEIFYKAVKLDSKIGVATVYRMINALEDMGAINRKNMYKLSEIEEKNCDDNIFIVFLDDGSRKTLTFEQWRKVIKTGLSVCGFAERKKVLSVEIKKKHEKQWLIDNKYR